MRTAPRLMLLCFLPVCASALYKSFSQAQAPPGVKLRFVNSGT